MKKMLVTGISGFLGSYFLRQKLMEWELIGLYRSKACVTDQHRLLQSNLTDPDSTTRMLLEVRPDAIIHLAAASNPNWCEQNPDLARSINVSSSNFLASYAASRGIPFVFASTDLVYDGQNGPYRETDQCRPINVYGRQKLEAERRILETYPQATIARLPLMFGMTDQAPNFLAGWVRQLEEGKIVHAFTDEFRTAASGEDVAGGLRLLVEHRATGIWNLGGKERMSRYEFAQLIAEVFDLDADLLRPSLQKDVKMPAARPADVSTDSSKAYALGYDPRPMREALMAIRSEYVAVLQ